MRTTLPPSPAPAVARVLAQPYTRRLVPDPAGGYTATIMEFPGCIAEGDSAELALRNLEAAAASWVAVALANQQEIFAPISFDGYGGKIALRIPRGLHQRVAQLAELEQCSINQLISVALANYVGKNG